MPNATGAEKRKRKPALNHRAVCVTEDEVLEELKKKENEKTQREKDRSDRIQRKRIETQRAKQEKVKRMTKQVKYQRRKQDEVETGSEVMVAEFATLHLSSDSAESDDAVCPKCGASYADIGGLWVCCDGCNQWFNVECTNIRRKRIPDIFYCEDCGSP